MATVGTCSLLLATSGCAPHVKQNAGEAQIHYQLAGDYFRHRRVEAALDELQKALANDPNNADAYNLLGLIGLQQGAEYLAQVDRAVNLALAHGLAVVIDLHPESEFKARLTRDDGFVEQFADFWRALAKHYSKFDPELVFLEILNEPELTDRFRWIGIQAKVASAIRESAPRHTMIATGARWSANDELLFLEPLADTNVIYTFHFYEPHVFTHQGANWGAYYWNWVRGLRYPSNREAAEKVAASVPDEVSRLYVLRYGMEHWDGDRIEMEINQVAEWARRRGVPVICNEFGVYRKYADDHDRVAWLSDVRRALERHAIGWTVWDYSGSFGVVTKSEGRAVPDESTLKALGLKVE